MEGRQVRRIAGLLAARLPELDLEAVPDPRARANRWSMRQILTATLVGLMAGCKSLWETEDLTGQISLPMRRMLGIPRRVPDTTMRDALCYRQRDRRADSQRDAAPSPAPESKAADLERKRKLLAGVREALHRVVRAAWRRKALVPFELPFGVVTLDGKVTAVPSINGEFAQTQHPEHGLPYGLIRTVTCALVSAVARVCIDVIPIPSHTNEMGFFQTAFGEVNGKYGKLFQLVTYDAGAMSEANGRAVVGAGKDYLFSLKNEHRTMLKLASELLSAQEICAQTVDILDNHTSVTRTLKLLAVDPTWSYDSSKGPEDSVWPHAKAFLSVESVKRRDGAIIESETRYFVSSLDPKRLTAEQWLRVVRAHWGVECAHHALDTAFAEDDRPWIDADEHGMLVVLVLRRIAFTILALYRSVTSRSDENRTMRWKALLSRVHKALVAATEKTVTGLRAREVVVAVL